ncbi:putative bifunctional diguanylate cyclase/phosphodiesterase [Pseudoalteromonas fenneropenaei]|uniref:Bifunctional diguanylate cyclase/phosphodiesterase n=1 Tax=Pseudoalteromonas fenneropenaei TaxID=1737459 RepID=A0ABV7CGC3_9GAMM
MTVVAILFVVVGLAILLTSVRPCKTICSLSGELGWRLLFLLIAFFCTSYALYAVYLIHLMHTTMVELGLALILFLGSIFVLLVINLSLRSIKREIQQTDIEKYQANHDSLTQLKNRSACLREIETRVKAAQPFALLLIDLNNFKEINDALGHAMGDKLLRELAQRLEQALLPENLLYRIGGDEFVLITTQSDVSGIYSQNNALVSALHHAINIDGYELYVQYSAGASQFIGARHNTADLLKEADIAMYQAKQTRQSLVIFSEELGGDSKRELQTIQALQNGLAKGELQLYYQPVYECVKGDIVALEALLRWPQRDGTMLAAEQFINLAMRAGILRQITPWVLARVHQDLPKLLEIQPEIKVHVNLSSYDLQSNKIVHHLAEHQSQEGTFARHVVLEIADNLLSASQQCEELLATLCELGYSVSIDNFAAGSGGLRHLLGRNLNAIKIDPSTFARISEAQKEQLLSLCTILASQVGVELVAKGIEKQEQITQLQKLGIHQMQGFHICEPMPLTSCLKWLSSQHVVKSALKQSK